MKENKKRQREESPKLHHEKKAHARPYLPYVNRDKASKENIQHVLEQLCDKNKSLAAGLTSDFGIDLLETVWKRVSELHRRQRQSLFPLLSDLLEVAVQAWKDESKPVSNGKLVLILSYLRKISAHLENKERLRIINHWSTWILNILQVSCNEIVWTPQSISLLANNAPWETLNEKACQSLAQTLAQGALISLQTKDPLEIWTTQNIGLFVNGLPWDFVAVDTRDLLSQALAERALALLEKKNPLDWWTAQNISLFANGLPWNWVDEKTRPRLSQALAEQALTLLRKKDPMVWWGGQDLSLLASGLPWDLVSKKICTPLAQQLAERALLSLGSRNSTGWTAQSVSLLTNGLPWEQVDEVTRNDLAEALAQGALTLLRKKNPEERWTGFDISLLTNGLRWNLVAKKTRDLLSQALAERALTLLQKNPPEPWPPQNLSLLANSLLWDVVDAKTCVPLSRALANRALTSLRQERWTAQCISLLASSRLSIKPGFRRQLNEVSIQQIKQRLKQKKEGGKENASFFLAEALSTMASQGTKVPPELFKLIHNQVIEECKQLPRGVSSPELSEYFLWRSKKQGPENERTEAINLGMQYSVHSSDPYPPSEHHNLHGSHPAQAFFSTLQSIEQSGSSKHTVVVGVGKHRRTDRTDSQERSLKTTFFRFFNDRGHRVEEGDRPGRLVVTVKSS